MRKNKRMRARSLLFWLYWLTSLTWQFAMVPDDSMSSRWASQPDTARSLFLWKEKMYILDPFISNLEAGQVFSSEHAVA